MKRNIIEIDYETKKVILDGTTDIWMADYEIADLFGVKMRVLNNRIKTILKDKIMYESQSYKFMKLENGYSADTYSFEMIIAISFQFDTFQTTIFRNWLMKKALTKNQTAQPIFLHLTKGMSC